MDVAFISRLRLAALPEGFLDAAPELVVEIISPTDRRRDIRDKISEYFAIGVDRVWLVNPDSCTVLVYRSSSEVKKLKMGDILEGEGILDGFALPLDELFAE